MKTTVLLQKLIDYYEEHVNEDNIYNLCDLNLFAGVCYLISVKFPSAKGYYYWIKRNYSTNYWSLYWGETPSTAHRLGKPIKPTLELRIAILKKELKHHQKWGILAR